MNLKYYQAKSLEFKNLKILFPSKMEELIEIFNEIQVKETSFETNLAKLTELKNKKRKQKQFIKNFLIIIDHILIHSKKGVYIDRTLEFIKSFVESTKDNCEEIVAPLLSVLILKINYK